MNIQVVISEKIKKALMAAGAPASSEALVRPTTKAHCADYQANGIMAIAKKLAIPALQLAERVVGLVELEGIASKIDVSGPGFINIFLDNRWLAAQIDDVLHAPMLGVTPVTPQTIVVDYSSPNVAKEMHVGHLRSTIIGDACVRTLEFMGHRVIRANHLGDWGTQFGMLIAWLEKIQNDHVSDVALSDLVVFYRAAKQHYDEDPEFAERARSYVVKLQGGDEYCLSMWRKLVSITLDQNQASYDRLNVTLTRDDIMGESLYNPMLPGIVADLKAKGLAIEQEGTTLVLLKGYKNKQGEPMGIIIQKRDGGYLYTTTDIACVKYRYETLGADRVLYYTDARQHQHFTQVWAIARQAGYVPESVALEHHLFGMILGKDGKPFKTRSGDTVKLTDLLDEAIERARNVIAEKNPHMPADELQKVAAVVGIGALKYADLSKNRTTDYVFDWDHMLALDGNTAPYIQYAWTRVMSIFRRAGLDETDLTQPLFITQAHETALAIRLLQFEETITAVAQEGMPHLMCQYLYDLAGLFSSFYEHCPILNAENEQVRHSRLKLALLTAKTLQQGLETLGIQTVERM